MRAVIESQRFERELELLIPDVDTREIAHEAITFTAASRRLDSDPVAAAGPISVYVFSCLIPRAGGVLVFYHRENDSVCLDRVVDSPLDVPF